MKGNDKYRLEWGVGLDNWENVDRGGHPDGAGILVMGTETQM